MMVTGVEHRHVVCPVAARPSVPSPARDAGLYGSGVRWERLFADLEAQLSAARAQEAWGQVGELVRAERAAVHLLDRVRAARGGPVRVHVGDLPGELGAVVAGDLLDVGADWVLVAEPGARQALVPLAAVEAFEALGRRASPPAGVVERRIGVGAALRALGRDRAQVQVQTRGRTVLGRVEAVGADHVDVAAGRGSPTWTVPIRAVRVVRSC